MTLKSSPAFQRITVSNVMTPPGPSQEQLENALCARLGIGPDGVRTFKILRRGLDARKKGAPKLVHTLGVELAAGVEVAGFPPWSEEELEPSPLNITAHARPIVVGAGPSGLFAALRLGAYGFKPLILERGDPIEARGRAVATYWKSGVPNPESNVQFGEGGAGAFSDGKLTSRSKDPRKSWVLKKLAEAGADPSIQYDAKPHLGTDKLRPIILNLRQALISLGCEFRFNTKVTGLVVEGGRVTGVETGSARINGAPVFLGVGHSARDVYEFLSAQGVTLSAKGFAVGLRIEASQSGIDFDRYGPDFSPLLLGPAEFSVARKASTGRGVYSFCMCPGGVVVPASTEPDGLVINGMSGSKRSSRFGNAALVVEVRPEDFGDQPLKGIHLQRQLEKAAQELGGRRTVPAMSVGEFLEGKGALEKSNCPWPLVPADLTKCLPPFAVSALKETLPSIIGEIKPLKSGKLLGVETRTSSPVRIDRTVEMESPSHPGLYPMGEGAGYAGGIVSSAIDGIKAVDAYIEAFLGK